MINEQRLVQSWGQRDDTVRPGSSLGEVLRQAIAADTPEAFGRFADTFVTALDGTLTVNQEQHSIDLLRCGGAIVVAYPHLSFLEIPIVYSLVNRHSNLPGRIINEAIKGMMPPGSYPIVSNWQAHLESIKSGIPHNVFAGINSLIFQTLASGGFHLTSEQRSQNNSKSMSQAINDLADGGNVIIWPSGSSMISYWRRGVARLVIGKIQQQYSDKSLLEIRQLLNLRQLHDIEIPLVFVNCGTFPQEILIGLTRGGNHGAATASMHSPMISASQLLNSIELTKDKFTNATAVLKYLEEIYLQMFEQQFLPQMQNRQAIPAYRTQWFAEQHRQFLNNAKADEQ